MLSSLPVYALGSCHVVAVNGMRARNTRTDGRLCVCVYTCVLCAHVFCVQTGVSGKVVNMEGHLGVADTESQMCALLALACSCQPDSCRPDVSAAGCTLILVSIIHVYVCIHNVVHARVAIGGGRTHTHAHTPALQEAALEIQDDTNSNVHNDNVMALCVLVYYLYIASRWHHK